MTYSLMIQAVADANLADARQRADRARRARQARARPVTLRAAGPATPWRR